MLNKFNSVISQRGNPALIKAAWKGMTDVVELLIQTGAKIHLKDMVWRYFHITLLYICGIRCYKQLRGKQVRPLTMYPLEYAVGLSLHVSHHAE